jgi:hypothetical protein
LPILAISYLACEKVYFFSFPCTCLLIAFSGSPSYTKAFVRGDYALSDRVINVFTRNMPPVMQVLPAQLTALIPINNTQSTFDVVRKILDYKDVRPNGIATFF